MEPCRGQALLALRWFQDRTRAARRHALPLLYRAAASGMPTLAGSGYPATT
ncbi:MAG TPA: hypothetical protein VGD91_13380 [Trebonia sp.]